MSLPVVAVLVVLFLGLWAGRYLYFRSRLARTGELFNLYGAYVNSGGDGPPDRETLDRRTREVHGLWRTAEIGDGGIPYTQPVGWGYVAKGHYSTRDNWTGLRQDIAGWVWQAFNRTIGYYEDRVREARNPVYTAVGILTAPQALVRWLRIGTGQGTVPKLLSILWSALLVVATVTALLGVSLKDLGVDITRFNP